MFVVGSSISIVWLYFVSLVMYVFIVFHFNGCKAKRDQEKKRKNSIRNDLLIMNVCENKTCNFQMDERICICNRWIQQIKKLRGCGFMFYGHIYKQRTRMALNEAGRDMIIMHWNGKLIEWTSWCPFPFWICS